MTDPPPLKSSILAKYEEKRKSYQANLHTGMSSPSNLMSAHGGTRSSLIDTRSRLSSPTNLMSSPDGTRSPVTDTKSRLTALNSKFQNLCTTKSAGAPPAYGPFGLTGHSELSSAPSARPSTKSSLLSQLESKMKGRMERATSRLFGSSSPVVTSSSSSRLFSSSSLVTSSSSNLGRPSILSLGSVKRTASDRGESESARKHQKSYGVSFENEVFSPVPELSDEVYSKMKQMFASQEAAAPDVVNMFQLKPKSIRMTYEIQGVRRDLQVAQYKTELVNLVNGAMLQDPNFRDSADPTRVALISQCDKVAACDPEFILKIALYCRCELNIRAGSNLLLCYGANKPECRPFLKKYFNATIKLPSDWLEVAEMYSAFADSKLKPGSLPAALRRAMADKFKEFDKYQLGKYNKEKSRLKKLKEQKKKLEQGKAENAGQPAPIGKEGGKAEEHAWALTLKKLVRQLHINQPVEHIFGLLGKKYPETLQKFYRSGLPGMFDEEMAGKRMKIPSPETWETKISTLGNKAAVWESLIDNGKIPFMAMLRNIRNMVKAGISEKHHQWVIKKLTNGNAVVNSKQFPFRFYSAYEVLDALEADLNQAASGTTAVASGGRGRGRGRGGGSGRGRGRVATGYHSRKKAGATFFSYDVNLLNRYRKALDIAVKISTDYNVDPIQGNSVVFCEARQGMGEEGRGRGGHKLRNLLDIALLLSLMLGHASEDGTLNLVTTGALLTGKDFTSQGILENLTKIKSKVEARPFGDEVKMVSTTRDELYSLLYNRVKVDSFIVIVETGDTQDEIEEALRGALQAYRETVNPELLFVCIALTKTRPNTSEEERGSSAEATRRRHPNEIYLTGHSDQLLRFIANRTDRNLLTHVENIAQRYNLKEITIVPQGQGQGQKRKGPSAQPSLDLSKRKKVGPSSGATGSSTAAGAPSSLKGMSRDLPMVINCQQPRWRTVRVFISSTFVDMHGERDLLTRFVFPELRARARKHLINLYEVDLRWGITQQAAQSDQQMGLCLGEISRSDFFLGMLGQRYGWCPPVYRPPDTPEFDWINSLPPGLSITDLEMRTALRLFKKDRAFFYVRDPVRDLPDEFYEDFVTEDEEKKENFTRIKDMISDSSFFCRSYPAAFGGTANGRAFAKDLSKFAEAVVGDLWPAILRNFPDKESSYDELDYMSSLQAAHLERVSSNFVGRKVTLAAAASFLQTQGRVLLVHGRQGCGKTAFLARLAKGMNHTGKADTEERATLASAGRTEPAKKASPTTSKYSSPTKRSGGLRKIGGDEEKVDAVTAVPFRTVFYHFSDGVVGGDNVRALLSRLSNIISRKFGLASVNVERTKSYQSKEEVALFRSLLVKVSERLVPEELPLAIVIDGIDRLTGDTQASHCGWIPQPLPKGITFVLSCQTNGGAYTALSHRADVDTLSLPPLNMWDKVELARSQLALHRKTLDESAFNNQMRLLVNKVDGQLPLYLELACEELCTFGVFELVSQKLSSMPHSLDSLVGTIIKRLEDDLGTTLVSRALSLLHVSKCGLVEPELLLLLTEWAREEAAGTLFSHGETTSHKLGELVQKGNYLNPSLLPPHTFCQLLQGFQTLTTPRVESSDPLSLAHGVVRNAVASRYLKGRSPQNLSTVAHRLISKMYEHIANQDSEGAPWSGTHLNSFRELPYHLVCSENLERACAVLADVHFVRAKLLLTSVTSLFDDYTMCHEALTSISNKRRHTMPLLPRFYEFKEFVARYLHQLNREPSLFLQLALGNLSDDPEVNSSLSTLVSAPGVTPVLQWENRPPLQSARCLLTVERSAASVACSPAVDPEMSLLMAAGGLDCWVYVFDLKLNKETQSLIGHTNAVLCVCFVGSSRLCSGSADGTLALWDLKGGYRIAKLLSHTRKVKGCAASRDGKFLVSVGFDCNAVLWNGVNGEKIKLLHRDSRPLNCVAFHPDRQLVAIGSWDCTIKMFDTFNLTRVAVLRGHSSAVRCLTFSPDGLFIASSSLTGKVLLWSSTVSTLLGAFDSHRLPVNQLSFAKDGKQLVSVSDDKRVKIWSGQMGLHYGCLSPLEGPISAVRFCRDSRCLLLGFHSGLVQAYEYGESRGSIKEEPLLSLSPHKARVNAVAFGHSAGMFWSCSNDGSISCTALVKNESPRTVKHQFSCALLCLAPITAEIVVCGTEDGQVCFYGTSTMGGGGGRGRGRGGEGGGGPVSKKIFDSAVLTCAFSPYTNMLAVAGKNCSVRLLNVEKTIQKWPRVSECDVTVLSLPTPPCHLDWVTTVSWSETGTYLVTASNDLCIQLWTVSASHDSQQSLTTALVKVFRGHEATIHQVVYMEGCIASASSDGQVKVWSEKGALITTLSAHKGAAYGCDLINLAHVQAQRGGGDALTLPDPRGGDQMDWEEEAEKADAKKKKERKNKKLAPAGGTLLNGKEALMCSCSEDGIVQLWKPLLGWELATMSEHAGSVVSVCASPEGEIITASQDSTLKVWTTGEKEQVTVGKGKGRDTSSGFSRGLKGHGSGVKGQEVEVQRSSDAASGDIKGIKAHDGEVTFCILSKNGRYCMSGDRDSVLVLWDGQSMEKLMARKLSSRALSCAQWATDTILFVADDSPALLKVQVRPGEQDFVMEKVFSLPVPAAMFGQCNDLFLTSGRLVPGAELKNPKVNPKGKSAYMWPLCGVFRQGETVLGGANGRVATVLASDPSHAAVKTMIGFLPDEKGNRPAITAMCVVDRRKEKKDTPKDTLSSRFVVWCGTSRGELFIIRNRFRNFDTGTGSVCPSKIHQGKITSILKDPRSFPGLMVGNSLVITASLDRSIKVWSVDGIQRGHFPCPHPIVTLDVKPSLDDPSVLRIVAGDSDGGVMWISYSGRPESQ